MKENRKLKRSRRPINTGGVRKIAVVTGARSEYGILKPLLKKIQAADNFDLKLIVTGMHLLKKHGLTINDIKKDGFKIDNKISMYSGGVRDVKYYGKALAQGIKGFTLVLSKMKPDILIVLGDRLEPLAAVLAAATLSIPIAHIHGGDKSDSGHIDESIRHSITRFAHIHFSSTEEAKKRLIKMGEERMRVFRVGALGLDSLLSLPKIKKSVLFKKFQLDIKQKFILCIFHPVHSEYEDAGRQMREILNALKQLKIQSIIIYPNNDKGSQDIIKEINKCDRPSFIKIYPNLNQEDYFDLLKQADVLIGNSSSGIIEAPAIKLPVVNIGSRNTGREHGKNVIFIDSKKNDIVNAITRAFTDKIFFKTVKQSKNPYGRGGVSEKIIKVLSKIEINQKLLKKKIIY